VNDQVGFVSLENFRDGAILKSTDGGRSWTRLRINDRQRNSNLEGVGFIDETTGWVGGWGDSRFIGGFTSQTRDGGQTWDNANEVGFRLNRFRLLGDPVTVGYASGDTVYKYSTEPRVAPVPLGLVGPEFLDAMEPMACERTAAITISVPGGARSLVVDIWERFGDHVRQLVAETDPPAGRRTITWDFKDHAGNDRGAGSYILRVTIDGKAESRIICRAT
jgi:FlgD Ig-like domain